MTNEADIMRQLQIAASQAGARLFRQQVGLAWVGSKIIHIDHPHLVPVAPGDVVIRRARPFRAGVEGMSDLGGFKSVEIIPDMIGSKLAVCVQVEVKKNAEATDAQLNWIRAVREAGGMAGIAHNEAELLQIIGGQAVDKR